LKVTVIGASPACPNADGACSGYLFEAGDTRVLVDCGPGVLSRLQRHLAYPDLTAIVISHFHADHVLDLVPLRYGLRYAPLPMPKPRPALHLPPGGVDNLNALAHIMDRKNAAGFWTDVLSVAEYIPGVPLVVRDLRFDFIEMRHYVPVWGIRVTGGGRTVAYSADTGPCDALEELAHQADLFICEATLPERDDPGEWGHLTPAEAGDVAHQAGVRQLILTHLWQETDREAMRRRAEATFGGPVELAREDASYEL
jgi:ribonuclease BN (tRNA processing enzyme)